MSASLRALLAHIVDYAGLFPPANLPLERALRNYARHRAGGDQWMLGRFIVPANRLAELSAFDKLFQENPPFVFTVLARGGMASDDFLQGWTDDLNAVAEFRQRHEGRVEVEVIEARLPDVLLAPQNFQTAGYTMVRVADMVESMGPPGLTTFYEISQAGDWRASVRSTFAALDYVASYARTRILGTYRHARPAGFKLRCAGPKGSPSPSPELLANVIVACRDNQLALKATAGLHHPVRQHDEGMKTTMHGFLNLFGGAILAAVHNLDENQVREIIEDEDASHFTFDDEQFRWRDLVASTADITANRQRFATAFGSCSFDEPREDLRALNLFP